MTKILGRASLRQAIFILFHMREAIDNFIDSFTQKCKKLRPCHKADCWWTEVVWFCSCFGWHQAQGYFVKHRSLKPCRERRELCLEHLIKCPWALNSFVLLLPSFSAAWRLRLSLSDFNIFSLWLKTTSMAHGAFTRMIAIPQLMWSGKAQWDPKLGIKHTVRRTGQAAWAPLLIKLFSSQWAACESLFLVATSMPSWRGRFAIL